MVVALLVGVRPSPLALLSRSCPLVCPVRPSLLAPLYRPFRLPTRMRLAARTCPRPWLQVTWMKTAKATWLTCWRTVMHLLLTVQFCIHHCYCRVSPEKKNITYLLTYLHFCSFYSRPWPHLFLCPPLLFSYSGPPTWLAILISGVSTETHIF